MTADYRCSAVSCLGAPWAVSARAMFEKVAVMTWLWGRLPGGDAGIIILIIGFCEIRKLPLIVLPESLRIPRTTGK